MNHGAPNRTDCYPSETRQAVPKPSAIADRIKTLNKVAPGKSRQTDT